MPELGQKIRDLFDSQMLPVVFDEIVAADSATEPFVRRPRRRWPVLISLMAAAALVASVLVAVEPLSRPPSASADVLQQAADTMSSLPAPHPGPGQALFNESIGQESITVSEVDGRPTPGAAASVTVTDASWIRPNGYAVTKVTCGAPRFASNAGRQAWLAAGFGASAACSSFGEVSGDFPLFGDSARFWNVGQMPTDAQQLRTYLGTVKLPGAMGLPTLSKSQRESVLAAALLRGPDVGATPQFFAALYRTIESLPGTHELGRTRDHQGRTGVEIAIPSWPGSTLKVIIDPHTGRLLESLGDDQFNLGSIVNNFEFPSVAVSPSIANELLTVHTYGPGSFGLRDSSTSGSSEVTVLVDAPTPGTGDGRYTVTITASGASSSGGPTVFTVASLDPAVSDWYDPVRTDEMVPLESVPLPNPSDVDLMTPIFSEKVVPPGSSSVTLSPDLLSPNFQGSYSSLACADVVLDFTNPSFTARQVTSFYEGRAAADGWRPIAPGENLLGSWTKSLANGVVATLQLAFVKPLREYELVGWAPPPPSSSVSCGSAS